jgi:hypothetical protein
MAPLAPVAMMAEIIRGSLHIAVAFGINWVIGFWSVSSFGQFFRACALPLPQRAFFAFSPFPPGCSSLCFGAV